MTIRVITVKVIPNAAKSVILGWEDAPSNLRGTTRVLRVRLAAPPVDGRANDALMKFLALSGGVKRGELRLRTGATSRMKSVEVPTAWAIPGFP